MIEKREVTIARVVITADNLRSLYDEIDKHFDYIKQHSDRVRRYCGLTTMDGTQYEAEGREMFEVGGIVDSKRISTLEIRVSGYSPDSSIWAEISHDPLGDKTNRIRVSGSDSTWVNGVVSKLEQLVSDWERQAKWPRIVAIPLWLVSTIGMAPAAEILLFFVIVPILRLIGAANPDFSNEVAIETLRTAKGWALGCLLSVLPARSLVARLVRLWPVVELKTGQDHQQIEHRRRRALGFIMTIVVIPTVMSFMIAWFSK